jgi:hypothetical protein
MRIPRTGEKNGRRRDSGFPRWYGGFGWTYRSRSEPHSSEASRSRAATSPPHQHLHGAERQARGAVERGDAESAASPSSGTRRIPARRSRGSRRTRRRRRPMERQRVPRTDSRTATSDARGAADARFNGASPQRTARATIRMRLPTCGDAHQHADARRIRSPCCGLGRDMPGRSRQGSRA